VRVAGTRGNIPLSGAKDVLQHNRERGLCGRRMNRVMQIVHHPVAQICRAAQLAQRVGVPDWGSARRVAMNSEKNGTAC